MSNLDMWEVIETIPKEYKPEQDAFFRNPVHPPKPWLSHQFKLGWMYATAFYGLIALLVILITR